VGGRVGTSFESPLQPASTMMMALAAAMEIERQFFVRIVGFSLETSAL